MRLLLRKGSIPHLQLAEKNRMQPPLVMRIMLQTTTQHPSMEKTIMQNTQRVILKSSIYLGLFLLLDHARSFISQNNSEKTCDPSITLGRFSVP